MFRRICSGDILYKGADVQNRYSPLDYFFMSFPKNEQLQLCLKETNINLRNSRKREMNTTELDKLFGITGGNCQPILNKNLK